MVLQPWPILSVVVDVRIVDGTDTEGRLEAFAFGAWRAICPTDFSNVDAFVACVHMGFGYVCASATATVMR